MTGESPYTSFNFLVEIQGIGVAGFSEVSGLNIETEITEFEEGGTNNFVYKLPKRSKYSNLTLKKGITNSSELYDWYMEIVNGKIIQKDLAILFLDEHKNEIRRWQFKNAFPVKWIGPDLNSSSSNVAFESIDIAHSGMD